MTPLSEKRALAQALISLLEDYLRLERTESTGPWDENGEACLYSITHKYPLGVWCWVHRKYQHEHVDGA
jgi:hypothetical protein